MTRSEIIGKNILKHRNSIGMSQVDFALAIGRSQTMVSMYEKGKRQPSTAIILRIADVLGVAFDDIYYAENEKTYDGYDWYEDAFYKDNDFPQDKFDSETIKKLQETGDGLTAITKTKKWKQLSTGLQKMNKSEFERVFNMIRAAYPEYFYKDDKK